MPIRYFWGFPLFFALFETVAVAVHLQDMDMVGEPVEQCSGQTFGTEHLGPFVEGQIAGYQGGAAVAECDDVLAALDVFTSRQFQDLVLSRFSSGYLIANLAIKETDHGTTIR